MLRKLPCTLGGGATFHVCKNAGKWSSRIDYKFKDKTTRMTRSKFISELRRMGADQYVPQLVAGSY